MHSLDENLIGAKEMDQSLICSKELHRTPDTEISHYNYYGRIHHYVRIHKYYVHFYTQCIKVQCVMQYPTSIKICSPWVYSEMCANDMLTKLRWCVVYVNAP